MLDLDRQLKPCSPDERALLRETTITDTQPGTIVRDFQTLLDFLAQRPPLPTTGKHNLLPINILEDLNARMAEPFIVNLNRPLLKSYPNLQGLYLLLRATGIGVIQGAGSKARLRLNDEIIE